MTIKRRIIEHCINNNKSLCNIVRLVKTYNRSKHKYTNYEEYLNSLSAKELLNEYNELKKIREKIYYNK
jgi:hypothetical protein